MRSAILSINKDYLQHNITTLKQHTRARLLAMVKANAYGHGVDAIVPYLGEVDGFGVACMAEALAVKACLDKSDTRPIVLIEGVFSELEWQTATKENLMAVIHNAIQLEYALQAPPPKDSKTRQVWLKLDSGMHRLGFDPEAIIAVAKRLIDKGYELILTSHFACADESRHPMNARQIKTFQNILAFLTYKFGNRIQASLCNSAGLFNFTDCHYDWVRPGIALYGSSPLSDQSAQDLNLKPVMRLSAQVMAIHTLSSGESVGYGALWTAPVPTRVGIVSIGYGDGYPRVVQNGKVGIHGRTYAIIGRVAMDMLAVDLEDSEVAIGDNVELWGDTISVDSVARTANTLGYELLCRTTQRPTRLVV